MDKRCLGLGIIKMHMREKVILVCSLFGANSITAVTYSSMLGAYVLTVRMPQNIGLFLRLLRGSNLVLAEQLLDIWGTDYPGSFSRFQVNYCLLSLQHNLRFIVRVVTAENKPLPSVMGIFPSAGWLEREVWDMFGIFFQAHQDLRRILTDYGFEGYPLRKDFPLSGYIELRYDDFAKKVVFEPLRLLQEYRYFDNLSPWESI